MSFLQSLNPFKSAAPAAPAAAAAPTAATNPADPNAGTPATPLRELDPLASFAKMYDTGTAPEVAPQFVLDDTALNAAAQANDFTRGFDPARAQAAASGDPLAMQEMMKHVGQQAYRAALSHGSTLTNRFTEAREQFNNKGIGGRVRGELTSQALADTPSYSNPVVREQLQRTAADIQRQHPDASPAEVAGMAREYITKLSNAIASPSAAAPAGKADTNWDDYFGN